jgi:hypothetical protein
MVRAILEGCKGVTRRVVSGHPLELIGPNKLCPGDLAIPSNKLSPYGYAGDRLWVKETFRESGSAQQADGKMPSREALHDSNGRIIYRATDGEWEGPFRPSIFMPRWASRIDLDIVDLRVERLWEITEEDAIREGVTPQMPLYGDCGGHKWEGHHNAFGNLWDTINAKRGYPWSSNPWVWRIEFRRERP